MHRNETKDRPSREARNLYVRSNNQTTLNDVNATAKFRPREYTIEKDLRVCEIAASRDLTRTITSLTTTHFRRMKIQRDGIGSYRLHNNYDHVPEHILDCLVILRSMAYFGEYPINFEWLYSENFTKIAAFYLFIYLYNFFWT